MAKKQRIDLLKKVYSKSEYLQIIDTSFNQFGTKSVPEQLAETTTVNDFFQDYNNLVSDLGDVTSIAGDIATTSGNTNVSAMTPGTNGTPSSPKPVGKSMTSY